MNIESQSINVVNLDQILREQCQSELDGIPIQILKQQFYIKNLKCLQTSNMKAYMLPDASVIITQDQSTNNIQHIVFNPQGGTTRQYPIKCTGDIVGDLHVVSQQQIISLVKCSATEYEVVQWNFITNETMVIFYHPEKSQSTKQVVMKIFNDTKLLCLVETSSNCQQTDIKLTYYQYPIGSKTKEFKIQKLSNNQIESIARVQKLNNKGALIFYESVILDSNQNVWNGYTFYVYDVNAQQKLIKYNFNSPRYYDEYTHFVLENVWQPAQPHLIYLQYRLRANTNKINRVTTYNNNVNQKYKRYFQYQKQKICKITQSKRVDNPERQFQDCFKTSALGQVVKEMGDQQRRMHFIWDSQKNTFRQIELYKNQKISFMHEMNSIVQFTSGLRPQRLFMMSQYEMTGIKFSRSYFEPDIYYVQTTNFEPVTVQKRTTNSRIDITKQGNHVLEFQNNLRQEYKIEHYAQNVCKVTFKICRMRPHCYCPKITYAFLLLESVSKCDDDLLCSVVDMLV